MSDEWSPTSVQVTVLQARGLRVKGKSGTNDAYAVMQVGKEKFQTAVVEKSVAPVWKEEATFDLPPVLQGGGGGPERCTLQVQVLHRALVGPDKLLGQAVINLLQLSEDKTRIKTEWFKLLDKTGKSDKERGEVLLDVQFLRNNMTASMFDLSAAGKSRSRLGKFKDKVRGKKKGSESPVAPSLTQVLTDSEEEEGGNEEAEGKEGKNGKSKKHKMKSLFAPKSNLQKNMSQSMSVLPVKNSSLSGSQSGLNVDSSEGKKKFKFSIHKRSGSSGNKDSASGCKSQAPAEQSNLCINGSHVYCEEPPPRTSRLGSNLSLTSSGHGSMEDAPDSSPSVESLKAVKEYSPCMEEEEEEEEEEKYQDVTEIVDEEEDRIQIKEESKVEETLRRWQELRQRDDGIKVLKEEDRDGEEKEMLRKQEELENLRLKEEREAEEERAKREEEERIRKEKMAREEEEREAEVEKAKREERIQKEMKLKEEKRRKEEEEQKRLAEEQQRLEEERIRKEMEMKQEEDERRNEEEQKRLAEQQQRLEKEEEEQKRLAEEQQRLEEEERRKEEEEQKRLAEEQQRLEEEERRNLEEERIRREEEKAVERKRREEEFKLAEEKRLKEEEKLRREEEERRQIEELMKKQRKQEEERLEKEEMKRLEEERTRKEREEHERLIEIRRKEEEKIRLEEEEKVRMEKEVEMRRLEELEKLRREEEKKREIEEMAKREEEMRREEEDRIQKEDEERLKREEEKARKKKEDIERRAEEMRKMEEEERIRREERAEKERKEEEERKLKKENKRNEEQRATEKTSKMVKAAEIPSTNPFDEDFSLPEEIPRSSPELHNLLENDEPLQQRCQLAASSARSVAISADEKDLINTQREKRPAPQPPGRNLPERLRQSEEEEEDECTRHLSQINKQSKEKDVKTVSVPPQRSVQKIAPLNRSPKDSNTQSEAQNSSTKQGKRPAPSRPPPVEDEPPSVGKTSHRVVTETQQVRTVHSLNPFEDDDDEEDTAVCWSPASQTDVSQAKLKSSKVIRAPPPPNEAPSNILIHQNDVTDETSDPLSEVKRHNKESEKNKVVAGVKEEGPPVNPRRLQTVKPLNPLEQQPASVVQQEKNKSTGSDYSGDQNNTKVDAVITGPYSQLTREELISLVLKQEKQLTEKDKKISELERYIDNLLVRVIEEQPSILMSLGTLK